MTDSDTFENFTDSILRMGIASTPIRYSIHVFQIGATDVKVPKTHYDHVRGDVLYF